MGAHIFLVGADNFERCIERGVYGCVMPTKEWNQAEIVAGILSIQPGDLVFFYVKNRGIYGLWTVVGTPYYDETPIWDNDSQTYPYRFSFTPAVNQFHRPIDLSDVFDLRDRGKIWAFDLNPVQQKNQYKITLGEAHELLRLLLRNNPVREEIADISHPYMRPPSSPNPEVNFSSSSGSKVRYEGWLNAWFIRSFAQGYLTEFFGDYNEFLNLVPTTFNKVLDLFLTHVATIDSIDVLYKYTCIELGLVDISFEPDQCRSKMQESDETTCEFFIASGNASTPLEFVDETFDDVAFSVADAVIVPWLPAIAAGRDDHLYMLGCEQLSQRVRIVAFVGNNGVIIERGEQRFSLGHIMALTPGQDELEGKAQGIDEEMDLAAESAPAST